MYPRVSTFKRGDKTYKNLRIIESYRDEGKVRQRTIANLGSLDKFTDADVDSIINGLCRIFDRPEPDAPPGIESAQSYGHIHAVLALWRELKLAQIIAKQAKRSRIQFDLVAHLQVMLTNRLCDPRSKLELLAWLEGVFIPGIDREQIQYHHLLRAMDWLIAHKDELEKELCNRVLTLFDQELDLVFYDLTSSYFETELTDELRKYGYSRDHRGDKPQVTIGLVTTRDGIPVSHHVFPGNTADKATVQRVIRDLRLRFPINRAVFVGDRGMLTRENLEVIKAEGLDYIVALNLRRDRDAERFLEGFQYEVDEARPGWKEERKHYLATGELPEGCASEDEMLDRQRLFADDVVSGRRLVMEHSESVSKVSARQRQKRLQRTQDGVALVIGKLEEQDAGERGRGRPLGEAGALVKIHDLVKQNRFKPYYDLEIEDGYLVVRFDELGLQWEETLDGKLGVETSLQDLSAEEVIRQYRDLRQIEDAFRSLKSALKLRPMHHWAPKRIEAHVFLCVIALTLERIMRLRLQRAGETMLPARVLSRLKTIRAVTMRTSRGEARGVTRMTPEQLGLFKALGIKPPVAKDVL